MTAKKMQQKFIARIEAKTFNDPSSFFFNLPLSRTNKRTIEISSKTDKNGMLWTTKVTASLRHDVPILRQDSLPRLFLYPRYRGFALPPDNQRGRFSRGNHRTQDEIPARTY